MRSQNLLDERGAGTWQPNDEDGIGRGASEARALFEKLTREQSFRTLDVRGILPAVVTDHFPPQAIALEVMLERLCIVAAVFECLAERELEMESIIGRELAASELLPHGLRLRGREAKGLEIRETPIRLAEIRRALNALEIGVDALGIVAGGLQRMSEAHPDFRLVGVFLEHASIVLDGCAVFADAAENGGLEIAIAGVAGLL